MIHMSRISLSLCKLFVYEYQIHFIAEVSVGVDAEVLFVLVSVTMVVTHTRQTQGWSRAYFG